MSNWSSYKRKQVNIEKAYQNDQASALMKKYYQSLHQYLVKEEGDEDTFNDTYLRLTYTFNPDIDFVYQFISTFKRLKGAYRRDDRVANYNLKIGLCDNQREIIDDQGEDSQQCSNISSKLKALRQKILNTII